MVITDFILRYRRISIIICHIVLIVGSYLAAYLLHFDFYLSAPVTRLIWLTLPLLLLIKTITFYYFGLFHGLWRYVGMSDIWQILKGNTAASALFLAALFLKGDLRDISVSILITDWVICIASVSGVRFLTRFFREKFRPHFQQSEKKVIIVGAGEAGILALKECRNNGQLNVSVTGFIDDDPVKKGHFIHGVKVLGGREDIPTIVSRYAIEEIILAVPSAKGETVRDILSYCQVPNIKLKIVPPLNKIFDGALEIKPRQVRPEDLLGRKEEKIDRNEIEAYIRNKRILVTGAGGSIGSELCRQIVKFSPEKIILFDHNENDIYFLEVEFKTKFPHIKFRTIIGDIRDVGLLREVFSVYSPGVVFHAAAHKHVPLMEHNPIAAVKNNIIGTRNLIYAASHYNVERFVLISTDKAVNPVSVMGATKRIAEMLLQAKSKRSKTKFMAVRFGNVIGSDGSVVPLFKKQIEEGGPVTVTHPEVKRFFMSITEAALLVLQAAAMGVGGEIFILDMGQQIRILDLAKNLVTLSGLKINKDISIDFIGLRPGEKLYEEMFLNAETDTITRHNKIFITKSNGYDPAILRSKIREMERFMKRMDDKSVIKIISELIPTYKPARENEIKNGLKF